MITIRIVEAREVWPLRHIVMYPDMEFESIKLPEDEKGYHLGLFEHETLTSVVSLFSDGTDLQFRKFATYQDYQGKGYGSSLLNYVIEYAQKQNYSKIWCNARVNASAFYLKFGFKMTDKTFFKDGFDFVIMEKLL
ncbi:GNAT family N-acetyltransferase [Pedobacter sp. SYSU D00535]|uniref:GNAT family N-acetyltransferase n=1 Tax=Pedobacter sp. SYSU D00535 TaxID=2810308 RepID=UPI001A97868F|nr:GNAT family N-acetyltransferase [Pedobacter sp. SYSU D00535]